MPRSTPTFDQVSLEEVALVGETTASPGGFAIRGAAWDALVARLPEERR